MEQINPALLIRQPKWIAVREIVAAPGALHARGDKFGGRLPREGIVRPGGNSKVNPRFLVVFRVGGQVPAIGQHEQAGAVVIVLLELLVQNHHAPFARRQVEYG